MFLEISVPQLFVYGKSAKVRLGRTGNWTEISMSTVRSEDVYDG